MNKISDIILIVLAQVVAFGVTVLSMYASTSPKLSELEQFLIFWMSMFLMIVTFKMLGVCRDIME